jgi:hypothetical protein
MAGKVWRVSTSGPDWTDVAHLMNALAALHESACYLEMCPDGPHSGASIECRVILVRNKPGAGLERRELGVGGSWPNADNATLGGLVMRLLYKMDHLALESWWVQGKLVD